MSCTVYLLIGDNKPPIYIGQTADIERRLYDHWRDDTIYAVLGGRTKREATRHVELVECVDRDDAIATEKMFINNRKPLLNVLDNPHPAAVRRREEIRAAISGTGLTDLQRARRAGMWVPEWRRARAAGLVPA